MKHFTKNLKWLLMSLMLVTGLGNAWGETYSLTPDQSSTGSNSTSYITTLTEFTYSGISWKMNQWNPKTLQVKTNQNSAASEFRFYNTSAFSGRITKVVITFSALTVTDASKLMFLGGTSEVSATTGGTAGTWDSNSKTLTWTPGASDNFTFFAFYQNGKAASGTNYLATTDAIVVTYEANSSTPSITVVPSSGTINIGETLTLTAETANAAGANISWATDNSNIATVSNGVVTGVAAGTANITASITVNGTTYSASSQVTVVDPNAPGTTDNPYTVAQARAAIDANTGLTGVYVTGIVSRLYSNNVNSNGQVSYYISDDGTQTDELEAYNGKYLNNVKFTSIDQIQVGDVVTIFGNLTMYNTTYELAANNYLVSLERTAVSISLSPTSATINAGETLELTANVSNGNGASVSYVSSNPTVASVNAGGIVTGLSEGTATITASITVNEITYSATCEVTVTNLQEEIFTKISSVDDLTNGDEYLIVYEDGGLIFDGSLTTLDKVGNTQSVTISDGTISTSNAYSFIIENSGEDYTIKSASGYYIGQTSDANGMNTSTNTAYTNVIEFDEDGNVNIIASGGAYLRYNDASNNTRFRYYKSATYTNQKAIQLYKRDETSVAKPVITPATGLYEERPQTVTITATEGATIYYTIDGSNPTTNSNVYTGSFNVNKNTTVKAIAVLNGKSSAVATSVISLKVNAPVFNPVSGSSSSTSYDVEISAEEGLTIYYITQDNKIYKTETGKSASRSEASLDSNGNPILVSTAVQYSGALTFGQSMMVTAVAVDADGNQSDPVTATYTYTGSIEPPYFSSFSASAGDFTNTSTAASGSTEGPEWKLNSNTGAEAIANWGEERYYMYVRGTSANTNEERTRWYGTADFSSPMIDLTDKADASFSFIHAGHHFYVDPNESSTTISNDYEKTLSSEDNDDNAAILSACHVYIDDYGTDGSSLVQTVDVSSQVNWFEQAFRTTYTDGVDNTKIRSDYTGTGRGGQFPRANSGDIDLSDYENHFIKIRFSYTSTPQSYGTWNIDQITINATNVEQFEMNAKGWTTYVFDHDIDAYTTTNNYTNAGKTLKIYKVTKFDFDEVVLQQLGLYEEPTTDQDSERYIPALTPVVIEGPANEVINFVRYESPSMLPTVKNNLLYGSLETTGLVTATENTRYFVLQFKEGATEPYFNKLKAGRAVPDHKAYLNGVDEIEDVNTTTNSVKGIFVLGGNGEDEATGIINVDENETVLSGEWFTLQGVRIERPTQKGIYIKGGKKVLVK